MAEKQNIVEQRKELFVKHKFQKTMILEMMLMTFIFLNTLVLVGFLFLDYVPDLHQKKEYIAITIAILEVIGFSLVYWFNRRASHRIAGPLFSLQRYLKSMESGNIGFTMDVRHDDQFHELAAQMNQTVGSLRERVERLQSIALNLQEQPGNRQLASELVSELSHFRTDEVPMSVQYDEAA